MTSKASIFTTAFTALALVACGGDDSTDPGGGNGGGGNGGGDGAEPAAIVAVSGGGQSAKTEQSVSQPFVVQVNDADGTGVSGASVSFAVVDGPGSVSPTTASTDAQGRASATFTGGTSLGTSTIQATVSGVEEVAEFTVETSTLVILMLGTAFVAPEGGDAVTVPVGTTVEWQNRDPIQHTATSNDEPPGGDLIRSGLLDNGSSFQFTPNVEGTWTYFCEVHPGIMVGATITATASSASSTGSGEDGGTTTGPGDDYPGGG